MDYIQLLEGIKAHPYATLIAASVVQGRITALLIGAFVAQGGDINLIIAYSIFVVMDILGDTLYYFFGRIGHIGGTLLIRKSWQRKLNWLNLKFQGNLIKIIFFVKATGICSKPGMVLAGTTKMPLQKFWGITVPCTLVLFLLYMVVGFFLVQRIF